MFIYSLILLMLICFYQDVRFRGIHWVVFPLLAVNSILMNDTWFTIETIMNLGFLAICMIALTAYVSIKMGKLQNITEGFFSWGDILFLLALTPLFDFRTYIIFFTIGTCCTLIFHILASFIKRQKTIPYAGYMAIVAVAFVGLHESLTQYLNF